MTETEKVEAPGFVTRTVVGGEGLEFGSVDGAVRWKARGWGAVLKPTAWAA